MTSSKLTKATSSAAKTAATGAAALMLLAGGAAAQQKNVLFIVDSSNSMRGKIEGYAKSTYAESALITAVYRMPASTRMGLATYGHRFNYKLKECNNDMELLLPIGSLSGDSIEQDVKHLKPNGQTPIARTLMQATKWFRSFQGQDNTIVLITDGKETCGGNPCVVAKTLKEAGIATKIHVVGFSLKARERADVECIAVNGGGRYFDARNPDGLSIAFEWVRKELATPVSEVAETQPVEVVANASSVYFRDDFDGTELGSQWQVLNSDPDGYIVEGGRLTVVFPDSKKPTHMLKDTRNIFRLNKPIPKGNWTMTTRFEFKPQTHGEWLRIGLSKEENTSLLGTLAMGGHDYVTTHAQVRIDKTVNGKATSFGTNLTAFGDRNLSQRTEKFANAIKGYQLRMTKKGRNYIVSARLEPNDQQTDKSISKQWKVLQTLTSLKTPGDAFTLMFGNTHTHPSLPHNGEGLVDIDWVQIETNN